ncbi:acyltransferase [uncultured Microbacterium sp.]|uniref:acyltransferase family protein n=1 Tax=uncultured Microbacterium sp. TaxID=191216 RepID=UPI0028EF55CE|nr:acyltransferase [uncultured Microbacterium sp.]
MKTIDVFARASRLPSFDQRFQPRANALNLVRLVMALGVIVFHSFALSGVEIRVWPIYQFLGYVWVDGFFAISGFLILSSWLARPSWQSFLTARVLRIYPAFWVCLVVTAVVLAPLGTILATGKTYGEVVSPANVSYVLSNATLVMTQYDIAGTPLGVPFPGNWNGSLWTLAWEFACYLAVLVLGVVGAYRHRWAVPAVFAATLAVYVAVSIGWVSHSFVVLGARFGLMFSAGMLIKRFAHRIPLTWPLVAVCAAIVMATMTLPDYRVIGAPLLAYAVLGVGALLTHRRLWLRNDISYGTYVYAFPIQQILASAGIWHSGAWALLALSLLLTLPIAALSWFVVERPVLRLKQRRRREAASVGTVGGLRRGGASSG